MDPPVEQTNQRSDFALYMRIRSQIQVKEFQLGWFGLGPSIPPVRIV